MTASSELIIINMEDILAMKKTVKDEENKITELEDKVLALENALKEGQVLASKKEDEVLALKNALKKAEDCMDCKAARKRLKENWEHSDNIIGLKNMGEISFTVFKEAVERSHLVILEVKTMEEMWLFWQDKICDRKWHPFKMVGSLAPQNVVDPEDGYLKMLRIHLGDEACYLVISALREMSEYSPIKRSPVPELWNFAKNRKATLEEALDVMYNGNVLNQRKRYRCGFFDSH